MTIKKNANYETGSVDFTFEDGATAGHTLGNLKPEMQARLALHGLSQKLGDSFASDRDNAAAHVARVWKNLQDGDWSVRGEGGPRVTQLARAMSEVMGQPIEKCIEVLGTMGESDEGKSQKKALAANPQIASSMARIRAEDAAKKAAELAEKAAKGPAEGEEAAPLPEINFG